MTTTPPLSVYSPHSPQPEIVYSNLPTMDQYYPPSAPHAIWWLENADIFLSVRGIVYGLRRIHFIQSSLFRQLLSITRLNISYGTTTSLPIPFDNIRPSAFGEIIYLLHLSEVFKTTKESWLQILQIAKDWEMPHVVRRATTEMDRMYFQTHPIHLRRWDVSLYRQVQERERRLRHQWIAQHLDLISVETSDEEQDSSDDEETIFDLYSTTRLVIGDD